MTDKYNYRVQWSDDDGEYVGLCAEFPSLSWLAKKPDAAHRGVRRLVAEVVEDLKESGERVPPPLATRRYSGRLALRIPPDLHRRLSMEAAEQNVSLSRWMALKLAQ
jgi:predicted HicB family RNase H-like nuclease